MRPKETIAVHPTLQCLALVVRKDCASGPMAHILHKTTHLRLRKYLFHLIYRNKESGKMRKQKNMNQMERKRQNFR